MTAEERPRSRPGRTGLRGGPAARRRGPLVVVGDSLLDVDLTGSATRLAPDAPVPVVDVARRCERPGGAGLAALLAAASVSDVVLVTALAQDDAALALGALLEGQVEVQPLRLAGATVVKTRIAAGGLPMLRLDTGAGRAAEGPLPRGVVAALTGAGAVLVSDYGRGVAALPALRHQLAALAREIPVVWDPHPRGPEPVRHVTLATPNSAEVRHFSASAPGQLADGGADDVELGRRLCERWAARALAVTQGERGAVLVGPGQARPVVVPLVGTTGSGSSRPDTCGAGDRFAASASVALLAGADVQAAVRTAVMEAAAYVAAGAAATMSTEVPTSPGAAEPDLGEPGRERSERRLLRAPGAS